MRRACGLLCLLCAAPLSGVEAAAVPTPQLVLATDQGEIAIDLLPEAAPGAVAWIERLAVGPLFDAAAVPSPGATPAGYFDGLAFDFTRPHVEILLEVRQPSELFRVPTEIDAAALGLDQDRLADAGAAMDALQFEILPGFRKLEARGAPVTPELAGWMASWKESYRSDFLVGATRQQVLEALGHRFTPGLASLPVDRGTVFLDPANETESALRLGIALTDIAIRKGTTMVVGKVRSGLDLAEEISTRPTLDPRSKTFRPVFPVHVLHARIVREDAGATASSKEEP